MHITRYLLAAALALFSLHARAERLPLESAHLRLTVDAVSGAYELVDKQTGVSWRSNLRQARLGTATFNDGKADRTVDLDHFRSARRGDAIELAHDLPGGNAPLVVRLSLLPDGRAVEMACECPDPRLRRVRLLDGALGTSDTDRGGVLVPARLGMFIPADSGKAFQHSFPTSGYEGCHCEMFGVLRAGSTALVTWHDCEATYRLESVCGQCPVPEARQVLLSSLDLAPRAARLQIRLLGREGWPALARAYRQVAKQKGDLVPWSQKLAELPRREALFGASNVKLWTCLARRMNEESTAEESVRVEWTFDQAAAVAEHLKRDLGIDRVLFTLGGWTNGGYDCRHPDNLPAAPECGGNAGLADCSRRVRALGYTLCLHDNFQDMYRDAASWSEDWLMKSPDGKPRAGGRWLGGRAWLTCSQKALELAQRPQNLPDVSRLFDPGAYFIDTTFAVGLQECFDPRHPLTRADDMHWKQELSRYARRTFGIFGSECGREWAIPCSDFFEGLSGVSGRHYHNERLLDELGARPLPVFEMIYHDCIQIYGKYGYRPDKAAHYVLHHLLAARPLNYHQVPPGLYWKEAPAETSLPLAPGTPRVEPLGARRFRITYPWTVRGPVSGSWRVFVHFTDANGRIRFQNDHEPRPALDQWKPGPQTTGPFEVSIPTSVKGPLDIRVGVCNAQGLGRAALQGNDDGEQRYLVGRLQLAADSLRLEEIRAAAPQREGDAFVRADNGWAEGCHPVDRFIKNTHEVLGPLNRLSALLVMTDYRPLAPDGRVLQSAFGDGRITVTVNLGNEPHAYQSARWGRCVLPPDGFLAEAPEFLAFLASEFQGLAYDRPSLFTLQSLDGRALPDSAQVRIFHGFGDSRLKWSGEAVEVRREQVWTK